MPARWSNLRLVVAWPTSDYKVDVDEDVRKARTRGQRSSHIQIPLHDSSRRLRFRRHRYSRGSANTICGSPTATSIKGQRDVGDNMVRYFPITDKDAEPRRQAVKVENCNVCHLKLATHGEARRKTEYCVMCHNAAQTDQDKRKVANGPMPPENDSLQTADSSDSHRRGGGRVLNHLWRPPGQTRSRSKWAMSVFPATCAIASNAMCRVPTSHLYRLACYQL